MVEQTQQEQLHGNAKQELYQINYMLAGAMQRMGCGGVQLEALMALCGFHPCNWRKFLATMEPEIGKYELAARDESLKEAVAEEVRLTAAKRAKVDNSYEYSGKKYPVITCAFG